MGLEKELSCGDNLCLFIIKIQHALRLFLCFEFKFE